ncbi:reverse transcriptase domain-containing protein [Tanacetum coccineum]|uniref:Reverse transcriptase domain-containing protein n=1 Tax=Tanacetum coccineum TaxID=301880 RepID=A0ABQ4WSS4_9ASTR
MEFSDIVNRLEKHSFVDGNRSDSSLLELSPASINHLFGSCSSLDPSSLCGASRLKTMQDAIEMATELMDKKISTLAERQAENKRKLDNNNKLNNNLPRDKMWLKLTPLGLVKGRSMLELFHCATDCRNPAAARNQGTLTCYECGNPGHYRRDYPELKNQNYENQAEGTGARRMVYAFGGGETKQDINNIEDEIEA